MYIPTLTESESYLLEAQSLNPGPWVDHSRRVAEAAGRIAAVHTDLDAESAFILGLLHDIGRRYGVTDMRHVLDGYRFLVAEGYPDAARACLTHSFPVKNPFSGAGKWDCTSDEIQFIQNTLENLEYNHYDRLIMLCDSLALPTGFCLIEKRLVDVALRHGFNDYTLDKWRAFFTLRDRFDTEIGRSIYSLLPGIGAHTFGFES